MTETASSAIGDSDDNTNSSPLIPATNTAHPLYGGALSLQPFVNFDEISIKEKVGHGSYGVVYNAVWGDQFVAVKEFMGSSDQNAIETEVKQLSRVRHHNIIALYGISAAQNSKFLIMEYAEGGSLHNFLHGKVKPYYSRAHAISWARQCAEGVAYLHAMKPKPLIHRDLKPLNLLLTNKGRMLKICDFGTVVDKSTLMTNNKGSAAWMAPEVFETTNYNEKCDIFSWAIVLWEVLSRQQPFKDIDNTLAIMWKIHKGDRPQLTKEWPEMIQNLMTSCWATLPNNRPAMAFVVGQMNELASSFPGSDEPLEYEYVNQQIIRTDSNDSVDKSTCDVGCSFTSLSTHGAPTNVGCHSNTSSTSTSTPTNGTTTDIEPDISQNMHSHRRDCNLSKLTRWDIIPEKAETPATFRIIPSAASINRTDTIRNEIYQRGNVLIEPISVLVDHNEWDLESFDALAKSDGEKHLTVTDTKRMTMHNNATYSNSTIDKALGDGDNDGPDQSLHELLDPELQPEQPLLDNPQSFEIYNEHCRLGKEFLRLNTQICYAETLKQSLLLEMEPAEREEKLKLLTKMSDKEGLLEFQNDLKQQLAKMYPEETGHTTHILHQRQPSQDSAISATGSLQNEIVADDGWVVISSNQNT